MKVEPIVSAANPVKSYLHMNCSFKITMEKKTWTKMARAQFVANRDIFKKGMHQMWSNWPHVMVIKPSQKRQEQYAPPVASS